MSLLAVIRTMRTLMDETLFGVRAPNPILEVTGARYIELLALPETISAGRDYFGANEILRGEARREQGAFIDGIRIRIVSMMVITNGSLMCLISRELGPAISIDVFDGGPPIINPIPYCVITEVDAERRLIEGVLNRDYAKWWPTTDPDLFVVFARNRVICTMRRSGHENLHIDRSLATVNSVAEAEAWLELALSTRPHEVQ